MLCSPGEWSLIDCPVVQSSGMSSGQWFWGSVPRSLQLGQSMWDIERTEGMKDVVRGTYRRPRLWYHHSWEPGRIVKHQQMLIQVQRPGWGPFDHQQKLEKDTEAREPSSCGHVVISESFPLCTDVFWKKEKMRGRGKKSWKTVLYAKVNGLRLR